MTEVVRLLLAAVFAVAGAAKLADRGGTKRAARDFGAPGRLARPVAVLLPLVELGLAAALVPGQTARVAAASIAGLLLVFSAAVAVTLARGRKPDCNCFGALASGRIGAGTLARNGVLVAAAAAVVAVPGDGATLAHALVAVGALVVAGNALLSVTLFRRYGRALRHIEELEARVDDEEGLPLGAPAPMFTLQTLDGEAVALSDLLERGRPVLVAFTDTGCGACSTLLPALARLQHAEAGPTLALVGHGDREQLRAAAEEHDLELLFAPDRSLSLEYGVTGVPSAVVVSPDGRITSPLLLGARDIELVVADAPSEEMALHV